MTRCEQLGDFIAGSGQVLAELRVRLHLPDSFGRDIAPGIDIALPFGVANQTALSVVEPPAPECVAPLRIHSGEHQCVGPSNSASRRRIGSAGSQLVLALRTSA